MRVPGRSAAQEAAVTLKFTIIFPCSIKARDLEYFLSKDDMPKAIKEKLGTNPANLSCESVTVIKKEQIPAATKENSEVPSSAPEDHKTTEEEHTTTEGDQKTCAKNVFKSISLYKTFRVKLISVCQKFWRGEQQGVRKQKIIKFISELEKQKKIKVETVAWDKTASEEEKRAINRAGFLFVNYEVQYWWYEIYETLKKLYFTCMVTLLQDGTAFKQMAAFLVNFAALVIHLFCRPWVNGKLDTMQAFSILVQTVTIFYSIMLFIMQNSEDTSAGSEGGRMFVEWLVVIVNCFVIFFPLLLKLSNFATEFIEYIGILHRIPIRSWIMFVWDLLLLILALYVTFRSGSVSNTEVAYFQLGFRSLAVFIGSLLCLNVIYLIFLILHRKYKTKAWTRCDNTPHKSDLYYWELFHGILQIMVLIVFYITSLFELNPRDNFNCVVMSGLTFIVSGTKCYILDQKPVIGWKALQTKDEEEAFGFIEEEEEKDDKEVSGSDNLKANGGTAAEESDAHRDDGHDDESDDSMGDDSMSDDSMSDDSMSHLSSDSDDEEERQRALQHTLEFKQEGGKVEMIESNRSGNDDNLIILRAWYGGPHKWLWQEDNDETTNRKKGKIVTDIVRRSLRADGALDFNPVKESCNNFFGDPCPGCHKILAVEYRYGNQPVKMWFSLSHADSEPLAERRGWRKPDYAYACFLPARDETKDGACLLIVSPCALRCSDGSVCVTALSFNALSDVRYTAP